MNITPTLPASSHLSGTQRFGLSGELFALTELAKRNYNAQLVARYFADIDLMIEGVLPGEVKLSRPRPQWTGKIYRHRWQFDVSRLPHHTDTIVFLIAEDFSGFRHTFIVPSWVFHGRGVATACLTSHPLAYAERGIGYLSPYLDAWSNIDLVLERRRRQVGIQLALPLFIAPQGTA